MPVASLISFSLEGLSGQLSLTQRPELSGASYMWAAPEQLIGEPCTTASDIYALGVVIWELCTGEQPRGRQCRPLQPEEAPQPVRDLIPRCRSPIMSSRPSIAEVYRIVEHQG